METDKLLTVEEAAEVLRVSKDWLYRRRRWATLPFTVVLSEWKILFSLKGILKYLEEKQHAGTSVQKG
jgi:excisionase family DNA binding protein